MTTTTIIIVIITAPSSLSSSFERTNNTRSNKTQSRPVAYWMCGSRGAWVWPNLGQLKCFPSLPSWWGWVFARRGENWSTPLTLAWRPNWGRVSSRRRLRDNEMPAFCRWRERASDETRGELATGSRLVATDLGVLQYQRGLLGNCGKVEILL